MHERDTLTTETAAPGSGRTHKPLRPLATMGLAAMLALSGTIIYTPPIQTQAVVSAGPAGQVLSWGYNNYGQLGDGSTIDRSTPVHVSLPYGVTVAAIAGGSYHSVALTSTGKVLA